MKVRSAKVKMCPCGHEERWHSGPNAACAYGHDHVMGGCKCLGFRSRRYGTGEQILVAKAAVPKTVMEMNPKVHQEVVEAFAALRLSVVEAFDHFEHRVYAIFKTRVQSVDTRQVVSQPHRAPVRTPVRAERDGELSKCARKLLGVLAQWHPAPLDAKQLCIISGYRMSGSIGKALAELRADFYIDGPNAALVCLPAGKRIVPQAAPLPKGRALFEMWRNKLGPCPGNILTILYDNYPRRYTAQQVCDACNYKMSGSIGKALALLRALALIEGPNKSLVLRDVFR